MPHVQNTLLSYSPSEGFRFEVPEWVVEEMYRRGAEHVATVVPYETSFVADWRIDEDPRLITTYVECQSVTMMDRANDEYLNEVTSFIMPKDPVVKDVLFGYDSLPTVGDRLVRCWYCKPTDSLFSYEEFKALVPQAYDEERCERAFCYAMLEHFQTHQDSGDLPYVTTFFPGKTVYRPDGSVAAERPGVVRTWKINGALIGPSAKWFDPTQRADSIAAREEWAALVE